MFNGSHQKIRTFLWFDTQAEEAANFYTSIFKNSKIGNVARHGEVGPGWAAEVWFVAFELDGVEFMALNGRPEDYKFTPATSLFVMCKNQDEVDHYWARLLEGGEPMQCGWLQDKFGVTWQIVPERLGELLGDDDAEKSGRVMQAMMPMVKLDIAELERAYAGQ